MKESLFSTCCRGERWACLFCFLARMYISREGHQAAVLLQLHEPLSHVQVIFSTQNIHLRGHAMAYSEGLWFFSCVCVSWGTTDQYMVA